MEIGKPPSGRVYAVDARVPARILFLMLACAVQEPLARVHHDVASQTRQLDTGTSDNIGAAVFPFDGAPRRCEQGSSAQMLRG
jgi:hypothetical protein